MAGNVPLNNRLERVEPAAADAAWPIHVSAWLRWNHLRTAMAVLAAGGFAWGLFAFGRQPALRRGRRPRYRASRRRFAA